MIVHSASWDKEELVRFWVKGKDLGMTIYAKTNYRAQQMEACRTQCLFWLQHVWLSVLFRCSYQYFVWLLSGFRSQLRFTFFYHAYKFLNYLKYIIESLQIGVVS